MEDNQEPETRNAKIVNTKLGYEDHGIFTVWLELDYGGTMQGFGGYGLDEWQQEESYRRDLTGVGTEFIRSILDTVGVETWEQLRGQVIRVKATHTKVYAIGNYLEDKWFVPVNFFKRYQKKPEVKKETKMPMVDAA